MIKLLVGLSILSASTAFAANEEGLRFTPQSGSGELDLQIELNETLLVKFEPESTKAGLKKFKPAYALFQGGKSIEADSREFDPKKPYCQLNLKPRSLPAEIAKGTRLELIPDDITRLVGGAGVLSMFPFDSAKYNVVKPDHSGVESFGCKGVALTIKDVREIVGVQLAVNAQKKAPPAPPKVEGEETRKRTNDAGISDAGSTDASVPDAATLQ